MIIPSINNVININFTFLYSDCNLNKFDGQGFRLINILNNINIKIYVNDIDGFVLNFTLL